MSALVHPGPEHGQALPPRHRWVLVLLPGKDAVLLVAPSEVGLEQLRQALRIEILTPAGVPLPAPAACPTWTVPLDVCEVKTAVGPVFCVWSPGPDVPDRAWLAESVRRLGGRASS